jgi:hypothetical protein
MTTEWMMALGNLSETPAWLGWQLLGLTLGGVFWLWSMALKNPWLQKGL